MHKMSKNKINGVEKFLLLDSFVFLLSMYLFVCAYCFVEFEIQSYIQGNYMEIENIDIQ